MKVFVYYNLHKHCWSLKALEGENKGRVVAHTDTVMVYSAVCKVSEAGRQRVLKEQRKNVHAGVVGWVNLDSPANGYLQKDVDGWDEITYNPYKFSSFVNKKTEQPVASALSCYMSNRKVFVFNSK